MKLNMKKFFLLLCATAATFAGCSRLDDLEKDVDDLGTRVDRLEELVTQLNSQIASLDALVATIRNGGYIENISTENINGINWYTITLSNGNTYKIHDGADGIDGSTPAIGVKEDEDGNWWWTVDGEYTDPKVRVNGQDGQDGKTPEISIISGYWCIRWPGDEIWTTLTEAKGDDGEDGDSFFAGVVVGDDDVTFTLASGETFSVSLLGPFRLVCQSTTVGVAANSQAKVTYQIKGTKDEDDVVVYVKYTTTDWGAAVDETACEVTITVPEDPEGGLVIMEAINNTTSQVAAQAIRFEKGVLSATTLSYEISDAAATIEIPVSTNMNYTVECDAQWLTFVQTRAPHTETLVFEAELNTGEEDRNAVITITGATGDIVTISVLQRGCPPLKESYEIGEFYERQGIVGIVWHSDENYVKVLALDEKSYIEFSPHSTANSWADSRTDGYANLKAILGNEWSDINFFTAHNWCHSKGDGWYLPAVEEMAEILNNIDALNTALDNHDGTTLRKGYWYWSSTQDTDTRDVYAVYWDWDSEKAESALKAQTTAYTARASYNVSLKPESVDPPVETEIKIGDAMTLDGGEGVVAYIDETGEHGYVIHKDVSESVYWATTGQYGNFWPTSDTDGKANCEHISTFLEMTSSCPAVEWAVYSCGRAGWFLPAQEQLKSILANFYRINDGLEAIGGTQLVEGCYYWSSTTYYSDDSGVNARTACYVDGGVSTYSDEIIYYKHYARAIHAF